MCYKIEDLNMWFTLQKRAAYEKFLVMPTQTVPQLPITNQIRKLVDDVKKGNRSGMITEEDLKKEDEPTRRTFKSAFAGITTLLTILLMESLAGTFRTSSMIYNEAKTFIVGRTRLYVRRFGYPDPNIFPRIHKVDEYGNFPELTTLNEDYTVKDATKWKDLSYTRNDEAKKVRFKFWHRAYM